MENLRHNNIYIASHIGERIQELCSQRKISINHLATVCNISPSTIKNIIYNNSKNVGVVTINKICQGLEISLKEFLDFSRL